MGEKVALCQVDAVPPGGMERFEVDGYDPLLLINEDGEFRLIEDECTHAIASLSEGRLEGQVIFCPLHGGSFNIRTGKACSLPCKQALRVFPIVIEDGTVFLAA